MSPMHPDGEVPLPAQARRARAGRGACVNLQVALMAVGMLVALYGLLTLFLFGEQIHAVDSKILPDASHYFEISLEDALETSLGVYLQKLVPLSWLQPVLTVAALWFVGQAFRVDKAIVKAGLFFLAVPFAVTLTVGLNKEIWLFGSSVALLCFAVNGRLRDAVVAVGLAVLSRWGMGVVVLASVLLLQHIRRASVAYTLVAVAFFVFRDQILKVFGRGQVSEVEGFVQYVFDLTSQGDAWLSAFRPLINAGVLLLGMVSNITNLDLKAAAEGQAYTALFLPTQGGAALACLVMMVVRFIAGDRPDRRILSRLAIAGMPLLLIPTAQYRYFLFFQMALFFLAFHRPASAGTVSVRNEMPGEGLPC